MFELLKSLPTESVGKEQIKGARISVYFRWLFIGMIAFTLSIQLFSGYSDESIHSLRLIIIYFISNIGLWYAVRKNYDPNYLGYLSAVLDVGIITYHLFYLTANFDHIAVTAASTTFLYPILFLLYTLRLNRRLLMFLIGLSLIFFNVNYFYHYQFNPELYQQSLSISPLSQVFKSFYIFFIGVLCLYMQFSMSKFIEKQVLEAFHKAELDAKVKFEEEKNRAAQDMIEKEKALNQELAFQMEEKDRLSEELMQSREQLHSIMSNLVGAPSRCLFDEHITAIYYSEKIEDITGYPASDFVNNEVRSFASIIHPDDDELCRNAILEASKTNKPYEFEFRIIHKEGHIVWVKETGKCIFDENREIKYLDGITVDVTKTKEAEMAVEESERRYKELMDFLPQPIFELDLQGNVVFSNKAGDDFFGTDPVTEDNKFSALSCFVEEDHPKMIDIITKSNKGEQADQVEYTAIKSDGSLCPVLIFGTPIERNGKIVGRRGIIIDISERKKYEMGLLKAKSELESINSTLEQMVVERTKQLTSANTQLLKLQKENLQSQFEVLKQQVNPHFLFNSLNVLTSLIKIEPDLAEQFTEKLSKVYRYVLENKEKDLVSLSTEIEFMHSYLFLLDIRFMKKIVVEINIDKQYNEYLILPIAIQLLIENAIKHNTFSKLEPLKIEVFVDEDQNLNIVNNLKVRETKFASTGVGLRNITKRYGLITDKTPIFKQTDTLFIAKLPLLKMDKYEDEKN